jgi:hypothetical protein
MSKIASMIPGLPQELFAGGEEDTGRRMKRMIYITDSMSAAELDGDGACFMEWGKDGKPEALSWRVTRVAKGSGTTVREVEELLCQYRVMANMAKQAGGKKGWCVLKNSPLNFPFSFIVQASTSAKNGRWAWARCRWYAITRPNGTSTSSSLCLTPVACSSSLFSPPPASNAGWHERPYGRHDEGDDGRTRNAGYGGDAEYARCLDILLVLTNKLFRNDVANGHGRWNAWIRRWNARARRRKSNGHVEDVRRRAIACILL